MFGMMKIVTAAAVLAALLPCGAVQADEAEQLAVLASDAGRFEKTRACRVLARVGTAKAVPVLVGLLDDKELSHNARYALEAIDDPSVDTAFRKALVELKGAPLVGAIGSVGVRRDARAVSLLAGMLADENADVRRAAARSLGRIATAPAVDELTKALSGASGRTRQAVCEGLLRCAESAMEAGRPKDALAVYTRLSKVPDAPHPLRAAVLRGLVLAPESPDLATLGEALRGDSYVAFLAANRVAIELPGPAVTKVLTGGLAALPPQRQIVVLRTLGERGDASAGDALMKLAETGDEPVRLAAVAALTRLGHAPAVPMLVKLSTGDSGDLADLAQRSLANFPGKQGRSAVHQLLESPDAETRRLAVDLISRQAPDEAIDALVKALKDDSEDVRAAALKALRDLAGPGQLNTLLRFLVAAETDSDRAGAEAALRALCAREARTAGGKIVVHKAVYGNLPDGKRADVTGKVARMVKRGATSIEASNGNFGDPAQGTQKQLRVDYSVNGVRRSETVRERQTISLSAKFAPPEFVNAFTVALGKAGEQAKASLVRVLRSAGGPEALAAVRAARKDDSAAVREAAFRALCEWPTPDALPTVLELARGAGTPVEKVLALRGAVRMAVQQAAPAAERAGSLAEALELAERDNEKRLVIGALGNVPAVESLEILAKQLDEPKLRREACLAAVAVAEAIAKQHPQDVAPVMKKVSLLARDAKLSARAKALAD